MSDRLDVDSIMAWGRYVDRRGRTWWRDDVHKDWVRAPLTAVSHSLSPAQMRLRIVREQHAEVCPGVSDCDELHPVPRVIVWRGFSHVIPHRSQYSSTYPTFAEAIDAAQRLAKEAA